MSVRLDWAIDRPSGRLATNVGYRVLEPFAPRSPCRRGGVPGHGPRRSNQGWFGWVVGSVRPANACEMFFSELQGSNPIFACDETDLLRSTLFWIFLPSFTAWFVVGTIRNQWDKRDDEPVQPRIRQVHFSCRTPVVLRKGQVGGDCVVVVHVWGWVGRVVCWVCLCTVVLFMQN